MQLHLEKAQRNVADFLGDQDDFRPQRFLDVNNQLLKYAHLFWHPARLCNLYFTQL